MADYLSDLAGILESCTQCPALAKNLDVGNWSLNGRDYRTADLPRRVAADAERHGIKSYPLLQLLIGGPPTTQALLDARVLVLRLQALEGQPTEETDPPEPRLIIDSNPPQATLDGKAYSISADAVDFLNVLIGAMRDNDRDDWVAGCQAARQK